MSRVLAVVGAWAAAAWISGCGAFEYRSDVTSLSPQERMLAISRDVDRASADGGDASPSTYRELVFMLDSDDAAERLYAIGTLERLTGQRRGYDVLQTRAERAAAIGAWEAWLAGLAAGGG